MSVWHLGTPKWCSYCTESEERDGKLICTSKEGRRYNGDVSNVLCAPCMKEKRKEDEDEQNRS